MRPVDEWFAEYADSHQNQSNKLLHWICVPLIVLSVIGLLWSIPVPEEFVAISPVLNWATAFIMAAIVYYFIMSFALAIGMVFIMAAYIALTAWLDTLPAPLWATSIAIFVLAWIGQFIGHAIEGKRPSFFKDMQFLMIGPIWLLAHIYRKAGISY